MPNDSVMKLANTLHRALIKVTSGRKGWDTFGMPVVKLTTVGRVSGKSRTVMLTSPSKFQETFCLVASKGGDDRHPDWYLNILKNPLVEVETLSGSKPMIARVIEDGDRKDLWDKIVLDFPNYGSYQKKTDRLIPIVMVESLPPVNEVIRSDNTA
ncbi:MAG: nitroreductase [Acidimicrobiaceae bacterium]|nr:nitroreductase [Acidimicrobiaceae bacterium]